MCVLLYSSKDRKRNIGPLLFQIPILHRQRIKLIDDLQRKINVQLDESKLNILLYGNHRLGEKSNKTIIVEYVHTFAIPIQKDSQIIDLEKV